MRRLLQGSAVGAASALLIVLVLGPVREPASADHQPADKVAVSASVLEVLTAPLVESASSREATLLTGTLRTSGPTDLLLQVTAECALWTTVATVGNGSAESMASVKVWIEIDDDAVPVSSQDTEELGKVVFCNRAHRQSVTDLDDSDARIEQFIRTRAANAFNWITLNVGSGVHRIAVKARLDANVTGFGDAQAAVGKRTLLVVPAKLANDASI